MSRTLARGRRIQTANRVSARLAEIGLELIRRYDYRQQLRHLLSMGPHLIADFGMTIEEAEREANVPVWQSTHVPALRHY